MAHFTIRLARPDDQAATYFVCLKTGDYGRDGEPFYRDDPDALGRIFVGPYLVYEPELSFVLEDEQGVCGYAFGSLDSHAFYDRYEREWRPRLCEQFPMPQGDPATWTRAQMVHSWYHQPDYFCRSMNIFVIFVFELNLLQGLFKQRMDPNSSNFCGGK